MIKPLSLRLPLQEQKVEEVQMVSPSCRNRADSLVFSVTSQKYYSPKETILIESKQHEVSKEIQTLQLKLENLESRVERIDSEHCTENINPICHKPLASNNLFIDIERHPLCTNIDKQNFQPNKVGKIVRKDRDSKSTKTHGCSKRKGRVQTIATHHSRQSRNSLISQETEIFTKMKELSQLKKQVSAMKNSMQKSQRSKSNISQRLSASKDVIKSLKKEEKKHVKVLQKLRAELRKSETIREKQKSIIAKQAQELSYYRELFKASKMR